MTKTHTRPAALLRFAAVAVAAGLIAAPAFAQGSGVPAGAHAGYAQPAIEAEPAFVPPNTSGHFTCAFNEAHTRLERKNCGGTHYTYGG